VRELIASQGSRLPDDAIRGADWTLADAGSAAFLRTMELSGISLGKYSQGQVYRGIVPGLNEAFIIDGQKRNELIEKDSNSTNIIKPLAVGDDVRKWHTRNRDRWIIYTYHGIDPKQYPAIIEHLRLYKSGLENRATNQAWYELQQPQMKYIPFLENAKIIYPEIAKESRFSFDTSGSYVNNKVFFIALNDLFLLGVLNSATAWDYIKNICAVLGDENKGGRVMLQWVNFKNLPIPEAPASERRAIGELVEGCLAARGVGVSELEAQINERVAWLYGVKDKG
jgi:hypothetical protein